MDEGREKLGPAPLASWHVCDATLSDCLSPGQPPKDLLNLPSEVRISNPSRPSFPLTLHGGNRHGMYVSYEGVREGLQCWVSFKPGPQQHAPTAEVKMKVPFITRPGGKGVHWLALPRGHKGDRCHGRREQQQYAHKHNSMMRATGRFISGWVTEGQPYLPLRLSATGVITAGGNVCTGGGAQVESVHGLWWKGLAPLWHQAVA